MFEPPIGIRVVPAPAASREQSQRVLPPRRRRVRAPRCGVRGGGHEVRVGRRAQEGDVGLAPVCELRRHTWNRTHEPQLRSSLSLVWAPGSGG